MSVVIHKNSYQKARIPLKITNWVYTGNLNWKSDQICVFLHWNGDNLQRSS